jgi:hypothetical protein
LKTFLSLLAESVCVAIGHFAVSSSGLYLASGRLAMVADLQSFTVEMYTPGEIVEARRSFTAETDEDVLSAAKKWINDRSHNATNFRVLDRDGTIVFDKLVAEFR